MPTQKKSAVPILFELKFPHDKWPLIRCPNCGNTTIRPDAKITTNEDATSIAAHDHDAWDPDWITGVFVATAKCLDPDCQQPIAVSGRYTIEAFQYETDDGEYDWSVTSILEPRSFTPPIRIIDIPPATPEAISAAIDAASDLYFSDIGGSANRVRHAVERYLDHQKVPKKNRTKKGELVGITLHQRIEHLKKIDPTVADFLMAAKWIGNAGSHGDEVTRQYLDVGLRVLEKILKLKFDQSDSNLTRSVREILERKGKPIRLRRRKRKN